MIAGFTGMIYGLGAMHANNIPVSGIIFLLGLIVFIVSVHL